MGENILTTHPDAQQAREALERAEVVVVQELFPTETAELADVVFAATSLGEKDGTLTSAEGRLQTVHYALRTESQARPDWRILSDLSGEMGAALGYAAAVEVTRDLLADVPAYASLEGGAIPAEGALVREHGGPERARGRRPSCAIPETPRAAAARQAAWPEGPDPADLLRAAGRRGDAAGRTGAAGDGAPSRTSRSTARTPPGWA